MRRLHRHVYEELKKDRKDLPIFASFTLHGMLNATGKDREAMLAAYREIMPHNDLVAVSFYPFIRGGTTDIDGCLKWLTENFDRYGKPYAVVETGEAAQRLMLKSGQVIDGTPEKQAAYFEALLAFAQAARHGVRDLLRPPGLRRPLGQDQGDGPRGVRRLAGLRPDRRGRQAPTGVPSLASLLRDAAGPVRPTCVPLATDRPRASRQLRRGEDRMAKVGGILETALHVADPARSAGFYRRLFGF